MKDTLDPSVPGAQAEVDDIDLLKKSQSQSQSQPRSTEGAEAYCACTIANLEGKALISLRGTLEERQATLEQLDGRVRALERAHNIDPPPPMDIPSSWDSLIWRVTRLHNRMMQVALPRLVPSHITPSETLLKDTLNAMRGKTFPPPHTWQQLVGNYKATSNSRKKNIHNGMGGGEGGELQGEELLQTAAQFLCHLAGRIGYKTSGTFDLEYNCKLALDLSLLIDSRDNHFRRLNAPPHHPPPPGMGGPPRPRMPPPPPPGLINMVNRRRCSCSCNASRARRSSRGRGIGFKARVGRIFGKLAFWRKRKESEYDSDSESDASSVSTRSSLTFT